MKSMMILAGAAATPRLTTERLILRPPRLHDHPEWARLRRGSEAFLTPWEPLWSPDHLSLGAFRRRISWTRQEMAGGRVYPFLIFKSANVEMIGGMTLENVRRGAAMSAALGYWLGQPYVGQGYMSEALAAVVEYAFEDLNLSRLEGACLPHNQSSRRLLERSGFMLEGEARRYLQINGEWRDHLMYERRRNDRL